MDLPHDLVVSTVRVVLDSLRAGISTGHVNALPDVVALVDAGARNVLEGRLRPVLNATGIVVHTNLGRAPWPAAAIAAAAGAAGYCNLQMNLTTGQRGGRMDGIRRQLAYLTGADDALVVNNCAAAVLLALTSLAHGGEVVVSRGELVEIGGSFRVPDVITSGGAHLVGVGTTNRTRVADYANAVTDNTSVLLKVNRSNFKIVGFTEDTPVAELVRLGRQLGLPVVSDQGSGSLKGVFGSSGVREAIDAGVDLVTFSGDKLLGGPQAGLIIGTAECIQRLRNHPMYRALRVDKTILAAVEATLGLHAAGRSTPVDAMVHAKPEGLRAKADELVRLLDEVNIQSTVVASDGFVGGGALPMQPLHGFAVVPDVAHAHLVADRLRTGAVAVVGRIHKDALHLDVRALAPADLGEVAAQLALAVRDC